MRIDGITRLPERLLSFTNADGELVPAWFGDRDRPWLRDLLDDAEALAGQPFEVWQRRWTGGAADPRAGDTRQRIAVHVLGAWLRRRSRTASLSTVRSTLFELSANGMQRNRALAETAARHNTTAEKVANELYCDLVNQRPLQWPSTTPDAGGLAAAINLAMVRGMLYFSNRITVFVRGGSRALLRTAWLLGMRIEIETDQQDSNLIVWHKDDSPPRQRGPASLVGMLPWTHRYRLTARCAIGNAHGELIVTSGDPIQPGPQPRRFDSKLEQDFANAFVKSFPDWHLLREPCAVQTPHGLAFPDFSLQRPGGEPWLCEIAGLRDPAALAAKQALLSARDRLVLCVPRRAMTDELRADPRVVPFSRRVDPQSVAAVVTGTARACPQNPSDLAGAQPNQTAPDQ